MANSRKSPRRNNRRDDLPLVFERALEDILARVRFSAPAAAPILAVAYSGGLDSSVLLHLAHKFAAARALPLYAFHIHHGLSRNADTWLRHCGDEAGRLGIPFHAARVEIDRSDRRGVEEAARLARYAQLGKLCRQFGATVLLTGHHQDDQAETVLLQMMRGAGLPGLSGMPVLQRASDLLGEGPSLARPLLGVTRAELEQAARRQDLSFVEDESNADVRYRRNSIRHQVLPLLQTEFPGFPECLARVAAHMQAAQRLLDELAQADLAACAANGEGTALAVSELKRLSADRAGNLLRHWLYRQGVSLPSSARLEEMRWQVLEAATDAHPFFDFGPVRLCRVGNRLEIHPLPAVMPLGRLTLQWRGEPAIEVPEWGGRLVFDSTPGPGLAPEALRAGPLTIEPRSGSERLKPAPNRPSKNLKHLFQELGIPAWQRSRLPLLYLDGHLIFVGGLGMDARAALASPGILVRWQAAPTQSSGRGSEQARLLDTPDGE
jgi:tRNA(Ile)-lysidine synthase